MNRHEPRRVLLAQFEHADAIRVTLEEDWRAEVTMVDTPEEAQTAAAEADRPFDVAIVSFGFARLFPEEFLKVLQPKPQVFVCINHRSRPLNRPQGMHYHVIDWSPVSHEDRLVRLLQGFMGGKPPQPPEFANADTLDPILSHRVRWLNPRGDLERGKAVLTELVSQLLPGARRFRVLPIGQGFSGAKVFRIRYEHATGPARERVLKLTPTTEHLAYKCRHELAMYPKIEGTLGGELLRLIPRLHAIDDRADGVLMPGQADGWLACTYDVVGGQSFVAVDLERAFLNPAGCLELLGRERPDASPPAEAGRLPRVFLDRLLRSLGAWYREGAKLAPTPMPLWSTDDARGGSPPTFPPYTFRLWEKGEIIETIHSLDSYGASLRPARWNDIRDAALGLLTTSRPVGDALTRLMDSHTVLVSPVHGDMNANNVFMALEHGVPFLIDLACYQAAGHAVQDFARLETAIKIELMGRDAAGAPEGRDLNSNEFSMWCQAEDWLALWPGDLAALRDKVGDHPPVYRAYALCQFIRGEAEHYHAELTRGLLAAGVDPPDFRLSYQAALLYHTLRAVRHKSLPHLKRIFAMCSVLRIVEALS